MQIVLVRHGATDWNLEHRCQGSTDRELSETGMQQAEAIANCLSYETFHGIYASDLRRAQQTAYLISQPHQLPVEVECDIRELDHGDLEGLTFAEIKTHHGEFLTRWRSEPAELQIPGGERLTDVAERAWQGLNRIADRHRFGDNLVVVSHNFPIVGIICRITSTHLNHYRTFHLDPGGISRLRRSESGEWAVTQINNKNFDGNETIDLKANPIPSDVSS